MRASLFLSFSLVSFAGSAYGWGCEGHQMVALIARAHLTPAASAAVDALLTGNPIDPALKRYCQDRPPDLMADSATWADDSKTPEKTGQWHYIDIPLTVNDETSLAPWCAPLGPVTDAKERTGCITNAMEYELSILRDKARSGSERVMALRYIIHFAGDIHQPLHDSDNNDHGGNCSALLFFGEAQPVNLHSIWDYKLIQRDLELKHTTQTQYARGLDRRFGDQLQAWTKGGPVDWAWEGYKLARTVTYGDLSPAIPIENPDPHADCNAERDKVAALHITIGDKYFDQTLPVINQQLAKAGYRLADLLNRIF